jgi:hypothetical protein
MLPPREVRMAYLELGMVELREIIRRWIGGDGVRAIARGARVDRKTVVRYVAAGMALGVRPLHQSLELGARKQLE